MTFNLSFRRFRWRFRVWHLKDLKPNQGNEIRNLTAESDPNPEMLNLSWFRGRVQGSLLKEENSK